MVTPPQWPSFPLFDPPDPAPRPATRRHAQTSLEAWTRVEPQRREVYERILGLIQRRGPIGATVHEIAGGLRKLPSSISGRLTELVRDGRLKVQLDAAGKQVKRSGARVLVAGE